MERNEGVFLLAMLICGIGCTIAGVVTSWLRTHKAFSILLLFPLWYTIALIFIPPKGNEDLAIFWIAVCVILAFGSAFATTVLVATISPSVNRWWYTMAEEKRIGLTLMTGGIAAELASLYILGMGNTYPQVSFTIIVGTILLICGGFILAFGLSMIMANEAKKESAINR